MPKRLKSLFSSFHGHKQIGSAEDQNNSTANARKSAIPLTQSSETNENLQARDLWQAAYDQLNDEQRQNLSSIQSSSDSNDKKASSKELIDEIIQVTEQKYEAYQQKSDGKFRKTSRKIIDAVLSYKEIISAAAGLDPTQHAASAWAVVSLVLTIPQSHHDARNAMFESSEYLADIITQCAFIEQKFCLDHDSKIRGHVETTMIKVYKAILCYSAQIRKAQEPGVGRNISDCFTAITGHPLTELKASIEKERANLRQWIEIGGYLHHEKEAENILLKIDEVDESLKLLLEQNSLMRLHVVDGALYDSHVHEHEEFCLPGTRTELLSHITDWAKSDDKFIFWLNGMAGTGKSTIARTVAQEFKIRGLLGATFFFKRGEADRGNATYFITSIAGQLVTRHRQLVPEVLNAIKTDPRITSKFLRDQFDQILYRPLLKLQPQQPIVIVIVIDALDECDSEEDIKLILHLLFKLQEVKWIRLRVVLTSRPELPIRIGFKEEENHQDLVLHELPAPEIEHDIRQFLQYKLAKIRKDRSLSPDWPGHDKIEKLVKMAVPLFIFASTACRSIENGLHPEKQLQKYLDIGSTNATLMKKTYLPVLQNLVRDDEDQSKEILEEFRDIVGVIILLSTPLSVDSLSLLLRKPTHEISNLLDFLHSVLSVPSNTSAPVRILHSSFRDYLVGTESDFCVDEKATHRKIALNCLQVMNTRLKRNLCDLASHGIQYKDIDPQIIKQHLPPDLQYCCCYWVNHLKQSHGGISESEILSFLQKQFLHWLEALALMGKVSKAIGMIQALESRTCKKADPALSGFLYDASRFIRQNAYVAGIAPLQLYCAGLVFAPAQSVIKRTFLSEISERIRTLPVVMDSWSAVLQTLEGHLGWINSVAFSPDGLTLASGSGDKTIKLWDRATGTQRQTLEGHSGWVKSVAFSPDGLTLASGSDDKTIKLWDTTNGTQLQTLEGHSASINSVTFSPDGLRLASGLDDGTIKLWDITTGMQWQTLQGHSNRVKSFAFSPDGYILASGSVDMTVKLWDMVTGTQLQTLEGHSDYVISVAFSPDGLTLASGSGDKTIKLWDMATGTQRQTLEGHSGWVNTVAFSPDGLTLASGSDDKTIRIWDAATGTVTQRQMLEGHSRFVRSVAFSPDGLTLASGSGDKTIKLWDLASGIQWQTLEGHSAWVNSATFSPDGLTLTSGSDDKTIKLWDTASDTVTKRQILKGHSGWVNTVAFSPDGLTLASGSDDKTIRIWNTATGMVTQRQTLEGHLSFVRSVAFSPDGLTLASGSGDKTIKLWDLASGIQWQTLEGHSAWVNSVTFSPDGLTLASGSGDKTIKLWDMVTGMVTQRQTLEGHSGWVNTVAFSPDGLTLASGSVDKTIKLWNTATSMVTQRQTLEGHLSFVRSVAFSPDGLTLASGSGDKTIKLWDTATGTVTQRQILKGHSDSVDSVAFSPDGLTLASGSGDNTIKLWDMVPNTRRRMLESYHDSVTSIPLYLDKPAAALEKVPGKYQISLSSDWVCLGGENVLWLPAQYRSFTCQATKDATLALGYQDGRVFVVGFQTHTV